MSSKITISEIAKLSGVSKATVSFYLNGNTKKMSKETYEKIKKIIDETGYQPSLAARTLNSKSSHLLGVIIGDITLEFANRVIKGIEDYANEHGYLTIVSSSNFNPEREKELVLSMQAMGVDGYIVQPSLKFDHIWKEMNIKKPIVYFDSPTLEDKQTYVKTNNYEIVYDTTRNFIKKGYKHFVLLTHNPYVLKTRFDRNKGCIDALESLNVDYDTIVVNSKYNVETLSNKLHPLLDKHKNICVFAFSTGILEMACISMSKYSKRAPEIGLIGFGNVEWCNFIKPSITTIKQPAYEEGYESAKTIINILIHKSKTNMHLTIPSTLIERESTNLK